MSRISSLAVTSDPPAMQIILEWDSPNVLQKRDIDADASKVFVGGQEFRLSQWGVDGWHHRQKRYSFKLERAVAAGGYLPGHLDTVALSLVARKTSLTAAAVVDGIPPGDEMVAGAISNAAGGVHHQLQSVSAGVQSVTDSVDTVNTSVQTVGRGVSSINAGMQTGMEWLTAYPFEVVDGSVAAAGSAPSDPRAVVDREIRAVLGRSAGSGGLVATLSALDRSFQQTISEGVATWEWKPASFSVQTVMGAGVTGRQASVARLAQTAGDEILPLLDRIEPLVPEDRVNPDEIEAAKAVFRQSWTAFVAELGSDGGPRVPRANGLLTDAQQQLQRVLSLLGMVNADGQPTRTYVVTADDEDNLTNGIILGDRVGTVGAQFEAYVALLEDGPAANEDRGTEIVLLQRDLDAAAELAQAVYAAMDSVYVTQDRREVTDIGYQQLMLEDVISWAASFPGDEAQPLLQDGGTLGAATIATRVHLLDAAVEAVIAYTTLPTTELGLSHPRVTVPLGRLDVVLQAIEARAAALAAGASDGGSEV